MTSFTPAALPANEPERLQRLLSYQALDTPGERDYDDFTIMASRLMQVEGVLQRSREGVVHLMANRVVDRSDLLATLTQVRGDGALRPLGCE